MKLLYAAAAAAVTMLSAGTAAAANPWSPLTGHGPQVVTIHILASTHGRENVADANVAIIPGVPVVLRVVNTSHDFHSFTIPQLHVNAVVMPGTASHPRVTTIRFTARSVGTFTWRCDFCPAVHHRGGMHGTLYALVTG